jgi:SET domain-containing protein
MKDSMATRSEPASSTRAKSPRPTPAVPAKKAAKRTSRAVKVEVRDSPIHGRGVYATRPIKQGERIIEYLGNIISWAEAESLPPSDPNDPHHTFLFSLSDGKRVIDASRSRNAARWINHSCAPNSETEETESGRVFVEALRDIGAGEEIFYDYCLIVDEKITKKVKKQYRCLCGAKACRGTMLALKDKDSSAKKNKKKKAKKKD